MPCFSVLFFFFYCSDLYSIICLCCESGTRNLILQNKSPCYLYLAPFSTLIYVLVS